MDELTLKYDENGEWKRDLHSVIPHQFNIIVFCNNKEYQINRFDDRKFDTEEKVLQEARYRLLLDSRPPIQSIHPYTPEQIAALNTYQKRRERLFEAVYLMRDLQLFTDEAQAATAGVNFNVLRQMVRTARQTCIDLGIDVI